MIEYRNDILALHELADYTLMRFVGDLEGEEGTQPDRLTTRTIELISEARQCLFAACVNSGGIVVPDVRCKQDAIEQ